MHAILSELKNCKKMQKSLKKWNFPVSSACTKKILKTSSLEIVHALLDDDRLVVHALSSEIIRYLK